MVKLNWVGKRETEWKKGNLNPGTVVSRTKHLFNYCALW